MPVDIINDGTSEYLSQTFSRLALSEQEVDYREFDGCTFEECDFSKVQFTKCKFIDCEFVKCNLSNANPGFSQFLDVSFIECKMIGVDWTRASWPVYALCSPLTFRKCVINDSSFFGLSMKEMVLEDCKAHDVDFREAEFAEANFSYSDLSHSLFNNTNLAEANFEEATGYDIDIYSNTLKGAKFSRIEAVRLLECLGVELRD
ncbi:MAG: pentapeptide repeat-containing protein [Halioglobus sp.]